MVSTLEKFGVISLCVLAIYLTRILSEYLYRRSPGQLYRSLRLKELGQWGVVLGADKSIGQAYAVELAKQGLSVVLIGNDSLKLTALSTLLEKYFQVFTGVISLTFTPNEFKYIEKALTDLDVAVLVNAPDYAEGVTKPEYFLKIPQFDLALSSVVHRNLAVVTKMCAIVMPGMVSKRKGIIVNVSSMASKTTCPLLAPYGASAAYVEKLSEELRNEYSSSGIIVQTLLPGYILGKRPAAKTKRWMTPSPKDYVGSVMRRLGLQGTTSGYGPHSVLQGALLKLQTLCPETTASPTRRFTEPVRDGNVAFF